MNKVMMLGRLTKDPELRYTANNKAVTTFTIAVNRAYEKDKADFFNVIAWNKLAEFTSKYFTKGKQIAIAGRLQTRDYEKEGHKVYVTEIIAEEIYFADRKLNEDDEEPKKTTLYKYEEDTEELPF